jgi:hypothetical protein
MMRWQIFGILLEESLEKRKRTRKKFLIVSMLTISRESKS